MLGVGGVRGHAPLIFFDKNGVIWYILSGVPKYVIINLKSTTFRITFGIINQPKFCAIFSSKINPDVHVITKK